MRVEDYGSRIAPEALERIFGLLSQEVSACRDGVDVVMAVTDNGVGIDEGSLG